MRHRSRRSRTLNPNLANQPCLISTFLRRCWGQERPVILNWPTVTTDTKSRVAESWLAVGFPLSTTRLNAGTSEMTEDLHISCSLWKKLRRVCDCMYNVGGRVEARRNSTDRQEDETSKQQASSDRYTSELGSYFWSKIGAWSMNLVNC